MNSDNLDELMLLFDYAISSDNPAVKKALKNLLLIASIVEPQDTDKGPGPVASLRNDITALTGMVRQLQNDIAMINARGNYGGYPGTTINPGTYPSYPNQWPVRSLPYTGTSVTSTSSSPGTWKSSSLYNDLRNGSDLYGMGHNTTNEEMLKQHMIELADLMRSEGKDT